MTMSFGEPVFECWLHIVSCLYLCRVFAAVVFTALSIGRASSFAPDASKAQVSAAKILALINRKPDIDSSSSEGIKLVSVSDHPGFLVDYPVTWQHRTRPLAMLLSTQSTSTIQLDQRSKFYRV